MKNTILFIGITLALFITACKKSDSSSNSVTDGDNIVGTYSGTLNEIGSSDDTTLLKWQIQISKTTTSNYEVTTNLTSLPNFNMTFNQNVPGLNEYSIPSQSVSSQVLIGNGPSGIDCQFLYSPDNEINIYVLDQTTGASWLYGGTKQ